MSSHSRPRALFFNGRIAPHDGNHLGQTAMAILIDGYNLLMAAGILTRGVGPGSLHRARLALLNFLAESLDPKERAQTTVVFDAAGPLPDVPRTVDHRGLSVRFASEYEDADALIEELIRADSAPRRLTVVSSDHRLQRAARRRRARAIDSDAWYGEIVAQRQARRETPRETSPRPPVPLLAEDVGYWLRLFGGESVLSRFWMDESADRPVESPAADRVDETHPPANPPLPDKLTPEEAQEIGNPFPPGYADDLLDRDEDPR